MKMNQLIFVAMDDNNMQMVQMSKTLSTKSIRDELCTNAGADWGVDLQIYNVGIEKLGIQYCCTAVQPRVLNQILKYVTRLS